MDPECSSTAPFDRRLLLRVHAAIEAKVCKVRKEDQLLVVGGSRAPLWGFGILASRAKESKHQYRS